MNRIKTYEGNEPYIFISYAHRDSEQVLPIIAELVKRGYRIWYDDGIAPGSEWPEYIAQHLGNSSLLISMISDRYIDSNNCKRELTYGLSKNIPFLGVILEPTEMSMGMEMQLSAHQCVLKYNYLSEERFIEKICSNPDMQICKEAEIPVEVPISEIVIPAEVLKTDDNDNNMLPQKAKTKKEKPRRKKEKSQKISSETGKKKKIWLIPVAILLIALIGIFGLPGSGGSKIQLTENYSVNKSSSAIVLSSVEVTSDMVKKMGGMKNLRSIVFKEDDFSGVSLYNLKNQDQIRSLSFINCTGVDDFEQFSGFENLHTLIVDGSDVMDEFIDVITLPLQEVQISNAPNFTDLGKIISDVNKDTIRSIDFSNTGVSNMEILLSCPGLKKVKGDGSGVTNIDMLASLENLSSISFNDCKIKEVKEEFLSLRLEEINFGNCGVEELSGLRDCTVVESVDLSGAVLEKEPEFLEKSAETIVSLNASNIKKDSVQEEILENVLSKSFKLESLKVNGANISPDSKWISYLNREKHLTNLDLSNCKLKDTINLSSCVNLKELNLSNNHLSGVQLSSNAENKIRVLDLSNNNLKDLSGLDGVEIEDLILTDCGLPAKDMFDSTEFKCGNLYMKYDESFMKLTRAQIDDKVFYKAHLTNVPKDQVVQMEDSFGSSVVME